MISLKKEDITLLTVFEDKLKFAGHYVESWREPEHKKGTFRFSKQ